MSEENQKKWNLLQRKVFEKRIVESFEIFRRSNIEPILIKGWAAARNYPNPDSRIYTDIDLAVAEKDFERAAQLAKSENIFADLHRELRHLDTLDWESLCTGTKLVKIGNTDIRILRAEDHLRVLCVHWLNDGGAHRERLWDIYYAVANRPADFDWDRCLRVVSRKRRRWIFCAIGLAEKYLGLDTADTPAAGEAENIPAWLIKTVEKEWRSKVKLKPLEACLRDKKELYEQLKIRIPPNPIQSTIEMEGEFDGGRRMEYQIAAAALRFKPLIKKIFRSVCKSRTEK